MSTKKNDTAATADKCELYLNSVQCVELEIDFIVEKFAELRGRAPVSLREDFCGAFAAVAEFVKRSPKNRRRFSRTFVAGFFCARYTTGLMFTVQYCPRVRRGAAPFQFGAFILSLIILLSVALVSAPLFAEENGAAPASRAAKVVSLSPAFTETIFHLGFGAALVGRSSACDYPPEVAAIPVVGDFGKPELEKIIRLRPDAVLVNDLVNPNVTQTLEQAGIKVYLRQCATIADYRGAVELLGEIFAAPEIAGAELARVDDELAKFRDLAPLDLTALVVIWDDPLMVAAQGSLADELLQLARVKNLTGDLTPAYFKCSFDYLLRHQPDVIVWTLPAPMPRDHPFWRELAAVKNQRVIADLNLDLISRPGPRIFEGIEALREAMEVLFKLTISKIP
jgi:iron complex transport system substrate-binding protein